MVAAATGLRDDMVNLQDAERKFAATTVAPPLLLPEQHVLVLPVRNRRVNIRPPGNIRPRRNQPVVKGNYIPVYTAAGFGLIPMDVQRLRQSGNGRGQMF